MSTTWQPSTVEELAEAVKSAPRIVPAGNGTKPNLSANLPGQRISTTRLNGIVEYEPTEFTFTAFAGTPLRDIIAALAERAQYLPFDPPLAAAGATLGGAVAAGLNGPGRHRFGGIRDFILGVRFVDGSARILRLGGKVVKNAAGFDLPKFFVGSVGRFGMLAELTFKVFPKPPATLTVEFGVAGDTAMVKLLADAARGRWEVEALEASLSAGKVYARLAGPAAALPELAQDLGKLARSKTLPTSDAEALWRSIDDFAWAHSDGILCKLPLTLARVPRFAALIRTLPDARSWIGAAGNVGYLSLPSGADIRPLDLQLKEMNGEGLVFRGGGAPWLGRRPDFRVHAAVKAALDSVGRFPALN